MQPTYLPWPGYFNLIKEVDTFVFFDDAQFQKNSWHNRNQINNFGLRHWITVPVRHEKLSQKINETRFAGNVWRSKHCKTLKHLYSGSPYFCDIKTIIDLINDDDSENLADLNIHIIILIANLLSLKANFVKSSSLGLEGKRTDRLILILNKVGATKYHSPLGAESYLRQDLFVETSGLPLFYQNFHPRPYVQNKTNVFLSHLSVVDLIANVGLGNSLKYLGNESENLRECEK